jgi:hypothetical protein
MSCASTHESPIDTWTDFQVHVVRVGSIVVGRKNDLKQIALNSTADCASHFSCGFVVALVKRTRVCPGTSIAPRIKDREPLAIRKHESQRIDGERMRMS